MTGTKWTVDSQDDVRNELHRSRIHNFTIRLNDDELEWLKSEAEKQHRTVANLIRYLLCLYRENNEDLA